MNTSESHKREWYLVYCKPRQELVAQTNLERQGYEIYLPMIRNSKRSNGRRITCVEPLFPRYLFIHLAKGLDSWSPIKSTIGVSHLVKFGLEPAKVPDNLVQTLMQQADEGGIFDSKQMELKPGDHVRIADGIMEGYEGILLARTSKERVMILLDSINSSMSNFEISDDQLELIS